MSKRKKINPSYVEFQEWYEKNRPRFKTSWRKTWDEITSWEHVPGDFRFTTFTNEDFTKINISYTVRNGSCSQSITIGFNSHYYFRGLDVMEELAKLAENGSINDMGNPDLNDALLTLTRFRNNHDELTLRTTHDVNGRLIYINASNGSGLMRVMLSLEEDRD